ncbi:MULTISPECIES: hypothetical protein [Haloarcula]|jgi:hypothetical protein|uniref:GGDEF domain-containing protein n=3 Tax=Haloarcula TaxID=2237 RepID=M0JXS4_9EURY|nr:MULTISPECIES: hypothetical protein [Haloarcula]EMA07076.1 hypothetical protein C437_10601 [Haloarcula vallismortis ATCC 29715]EMA13781.1 hypothetical protein C436_10446 [Haloarcula sinaiiensis ATCC 33800]NHX38554.1 hypothetical protein [Haloarcula sp. R1-2]QUJ73504.1 hypothetical protein KDQ40_07095 [Haloarcula sinaiiensis ATCC 33800]SDW56739.1 hypothetical protein SAMN05443574_104274 [Haloarcula vallismortis]
MSLVLNGARIAAAVNILLLGVLISIWVQTYREIRAPLTLGSIVFASFLLAENAVALYFYFTAPAMPAVAVQVMMVLQMLETIGIGVLTYFTWK